MTSNPARLGARHENAPRSSDAGLPVTADNMLAASVMTLGYGVLIGFTDNLVPLISADVGLWQFHVMRSGVGLPFLVLVAYVLGLHLRPRRWWPVILRSALQGVSMTIYFGALAFLPVPMVAAGLYTAPIFVLLVSALVYGERFSLGQIAAVALGFVGVLLVLGPQALDGASLAAVLPVLAGAIYALSNMATRRLCAGESATTMLAGFFVAMFLIGLMGTVIFTLWPQVVPEGAAGFVLRGYVSVPPMLWVWTLLQAGGALLAVGLVTRAYQLAAAEKVSVLEYSSLLTAAFWGWLMWGHVLGFLAWSGMALIVISGAIIALGGNRRVARKAA